MLRNDKELKDDSLLLNIGFALVFASMAYYPAVMILMLTSSLEVAIGVLFLTLFLTFIGYHGMKPSRLGSCAFILTIIFIAVFMRYDI